MTVTADEGKQFADLNVPIHPKSMSDEEAFLRAKNGHCVVFRESVSTPGDLTVFVPEGIKYRLNDIKTQNSDQFGSMKNIVESISLITNLPVHSPKTIMQNIKQKVRCHGDDITKAEGISMAIKENALVFHQPAPLIIGETSLSSEIRIYRPEGEPAFLETIIQKHPEKFINLNTSVAAISELLGYPPHELLTERTNGVPPIIIRNPELPAQIAKPVTMTAANLKSAVNTLRTESDAIKTLKERDIVLKKSAVTVDEVLHMAKVTKCCILRESDTDPTGITVYTPTGEKFRLKEIVAKFPECLKNDVSLSKTLGAVLLFPLITTDKIAEFNQLKSNYTPGF